MLAIVIQMTFHLGAPRGATSSNPDCAEASTIAVTVLAGPLNYAGLNPESHVYDQ
jgi:hypothetical protein